MSSQNTRTTRYSTRNNKNRSNVKQSSTRRQNDDGARDRSNSSGDETEIKPGRIRYNLRKRSLDSSSESVSGDVGDQKDTRKRRRSSSRSVAPYLKGNAVGARYIQEELPDEVLLKILSYLLEYDLCRVACVCKRFRTIANDTELWKKLYQDVFEYDYPLLHPEPRIFKFLHPQVYCDYDNPWKESFRQLCKGLHVRPGFRDLYHRKYRRLRGRDMKVT